MSRDMMSAFELYQPDTVEGAVELLGRFGAEGWALAGGNDSFDWFKDRVKRPKYVVDLGGIAALKGIRETPDGGVEIGALTTLTEIERSAVVQNRYGVARRCGTPRREPADQKLGHDRRQRLPRRALLVLPVWRRLLSRRRQHLLCRHARRPEPRALPVGRRSLRRREPLGYGSGARRARCDDGRSRARRSTRGQSRGVFHRPEHRHREDDGARGRRRADGDSFAGRMERGAVLFREGRRPQHVGLPAREHRGGHEGQRRCGRRDGRSNSHRGGRGAMRAAAAHGRGRSRARSGEDGRDGVAWRGRARCAARRR